MIKGTIKFLTQYYTILENPYGHMLFQNVIEHCGFMQIDGDVFLYYQELELFHVKAYISFSEP